MKVLHLMVPIWPTEHFRGLGSARALMQDVHDDVMDLPGGSIYFTDTFNVNRIFSGRLSYDKGNAVIHTLRFELGDSVFFLGLKNFLTQHAFGNAGITDFKTSIEATSGKNLTDFFNQWIYGEGYPIYRASYFSDLSNLYLRVEHNVSSNTPTFITPLEIKCNSILNGDTIIRINVTSNNDTYIIPMSKIINGLDIDPNNWVLNRDSTISLDPSLISLNISNIELENSISIYPNPSKGQFTLENNLGRDYAITVSSVLGTPLFYAKKLGPIERIDLSQFASGVYYVTINTEKGQSSQKTN